MNESKSGCVPPIGFFEPEKKKSGEIFRNRFILSSENRVVSGSFINFRRQVSLTSIQIQSLSLVFLVVFLFFNNFFPDLNYSHELLSIFDRQKYTMKIRSENRIVK